MNPVYNNYNGSHDRQHEINNHYNGFHDRQHEINNHYMGNQLNYDRQHNLINKIKILTN